MEEGAAAAAAAATTTTTTTATTAAKKRKFHHHHDRHQRHVAIQKAERELLQLDQQTKDLKDFIQRLREEDKEEEKKLRSDCINDAVAAVSSSNSSNEEEDDDDKDDIPLLHHVMEFLGPADVASCAQVNHQWNYDIDGNPQIWKMAVQNHSSVKFIQLLERKTSTTTNNNSQPSSSSSSSLPKNLKPPPPPPPPPPLFYKKVALGLIKTQSSLSAPAGDDADIDRRHRNNISVEDANWLLKQYKPKLQREDVIVYIEVKDKATDNVLQAWFTNLIDFEDEYEDCAFRLDHQNVLLPATVNEVTFQEAWEKTVSEDWYDVDRESFAPEEIRNSIYFTIRCFRCDTGESIYWNDFNEDEIPYDGYIYFDSDNTYCTAKNDSGIVARDVWRIRKYYAMYMSVSCNIDPIHGNDSNDSKVEFYLKNLCCSFCLRGQDYHGPFTVDDVNEVLLSLEGMVWQ